MLGNTSSCAFQVWFGSCVLGLCRLMVLHRRLIFFRTPQLHLIKLGHHDVILRLWCFGHGRTDWGSQYLNWEEVYCATIVLGRYSSHSGKIHYIQDADLFLYMWHHLRQTLAFYASGLVTPSIHLLPAKFASVQAKPLTGHILGSSTSALIYQAGESKGVA